MLVMVMAPQASEDRSSTNLSGSSDVIIEIQWMRKWEAFDRQHYCRQYQMLSWSTNVCQFICIGFAIIMIGWTAERATLCLNGTSRTF
jgi:hypothetical protein